MNPFIYPVSQAPRTAVLVPWFRSPWSVPFLTHQSVRVFPEGWGVEAARHEPAAIAGTGEQLRALMPWRIPSLTHAVIVLARPRGRRLSDLDRDRLWRAFHVPVFEQVVGKAGELLAFECEAHDGLHVESPRLPLKGEIVCTEPCACGRETPRIGVEVEQAHGLSSFPGGEFDALR